MTEVDTLKERARRSIEAVADTLIGLSHRIQANPELAFQEHRASAWVTETLAENGFTVERGVADLPTAIVATAGTGALTIGLCAEYDGLPEVGHACGTPSSRPHPWEPASLWPHSRTISASP